MENNDTSFLGTGWSFPPEFTMGGREVRMVSAADDISQSLEILLGTRLNERILQESYGSNLDEYVFESLSSSVLNSLKREIGDAILYHEPRIELQGVDVELDPSQEGLLWITIDYIIPASNTRFNMVYPFYLQENNS